MVENTLAETPPTNRGRQRFPAKLPSTLVNPADVHTVIGLSRSWCDREEAAGRFPRKVVLSRGEKGRAGRTAWVREELEAWLQERMKERANNS